MRFRVLTLAVGLCALASWAGCDGCNDSGFDAGVPDTSLTGGTFSLAWTLLDQTTNRPVTCDKLDPNATVFVTASRPGTGGLESFACKNGQATSITRFAPGTYNFSYELHASANGQTLTVATAPAQNGVTITSGGNVVLAPITFLVDASGGLVLTLHTLPAGNCTGGAGITGFTISLEHAGGPGDTGCADVTFTLSGGGTYRANDCTAPMPSRCIQSSETLTVASLPSGPYQIHVRGLKSQNICWSNDDALRVPPQGKTLATALNLALASETPGCQ